MVKRKLKERSIQRVNNGTLAVGRQVQSVEPQTALLSGFESAIDEEFQRRTFTSEQEAIDFLIAAVASRLADSADQEADMCQFLKLLVDTDPELKGQLLEGALNAKKG